MFNKDRKRELRFGTLLFAPPVLHLLCLVFCIFHPPNHPCTSPWNCTCASAQFHPLGSYTIHKRLGEMRESSCFESSVVLSLLQDHPLPFFTCLPTPRLQNFTPKSFAVATFCCRSVSPCCTPRTFTYQSRLFWAVFVVSVFGSPFPAASSAPTCAKQINGEPFESKPRLRL